MNRDYNGPERRRDATLLQQLLEEVHGIRADQKEDREKLSEMYDAWTRAKGAWWIVLRVTAFLAAIGTAAAWLFDHWHRINK